MDGVFEGSQPPGQFPRSVPLGAPERPLAALIIDDNGRFRTALAGLLGRAGLDVREAGDGLEGIMSARDRTPDVVVTDIYMPGVGGLPTIAHLRQEWPGLKIIAMSAADAPATDLAQRSTALGADHFLEKPFAVDDLVALIGRLCPRQNGPRLFA